MTQTEHILACPLNTILTFLCESATYRPKYKLPVRHLVAKEKKKINITPWKICIAYSRYLAKYCNFLTDRSEAHEKRASEAGLEGMKVKTKMMPPFYTTIR